MATPGVDYYTCFEDDPPNDDISLEALTGTRKISVTSHITALLNFLSEIEPQGSTDAQRVTRNDIAYCIRVYGQSSTNWRSHFH